MAVNVADAKGLTFECKPGCGFCCTASPLVGPHERARLPMAIRAPDGNLRIPLAGVACSALAGDRRCGIYDVRPTVCHLYPYAVHAGRRIQVTVSLACPGVSAGSAGAGERGSEVRLTAKAQGQDASSSRYPAVALPSSPAPSLPPPFADDITHPFGVADNMDRGAQRAADLALAQPGAAEEAARARSTFAEFDRRMREWNVAASPDKLRAAFLPHVATLAQPAALPALFAGIAEGDLMLEGDGARVVAELFASEADADLVDLYVEGAKDAFDEPDTVLWVEPDLSWTRASASAGDGARVELTRMANGAQRTATLDVEELPGEWQAAASDVVAAYLARLMHRDHAEGAAAWLVDASGYQATPAAAFARVIGEAALQVALRSSLLAADEGRDTIDVTHARRGVMAYETAFHSLPTLGAIL